MPTHEEYKKNKSYYDNYRRRNVEYWKEYRKRKKNENPEEWRKYNRNRYYKRVYGISEEDKNNMLINQNYRCALCGCDLNVIRYAIDHDHNSGKVRDILCISCNTALGSFQENISLLANAITYLEKWK